uniref:Cugbp, Elav-like family member 5a n=1 Tax=Erpetoichthys calabaricus TaxID=27687 RepID=A0A8C4TGW6_ERPCA
MQQQAALMAATHGGYLTPSVAFPTAQIHQMGALNLNGLPPAAMTPVSGLSSPPAIATSAVPSIVTPIVNGFTGIPHQPNGHPAVEAVYTNGLPPYSAQSPTAADTLQQAFTGVQQYTGEHVFSSSSFLAFPLSVPHNLPAFFSTSIFAVSMSFGRKSILLSTNAGHCAIEMTGRYSSVVPQQSNTCPGRGRGICSFCLLWKTLPCLI